MPTRKKFTTIDGVAEGSEFTLNMPIGPTYGKVKFTLGGTAFTPAHIVSPARMSGHGLKRQPLHAYR